MSFSINTNLASLQAQNYLTKSSQFQSQTINRVTSGLRIVNSGDDAAGLAIANGFRSDEAVLNQGIQNGNNGLATLQTVDSGMNNISTLLDRARTLATESASGTFTGDRNSLNSEFQSVMTEIDRQAQSIGMNQGGAFAQAMTVFIGGGRGATSAQAITNGSISLDLSRATVDTKSLGLKGFTAGYQAASGSPDTGFYDLSNGSTTSVSAILTAQSNPATTTFTISGAGFSDGNATTVTVNLANVSDTTSLVNAINNGIASAASAGTASANAFKAANITAAIHTGADGHQQLLLTSSSNAFQVTAGDATANAFMGNLGTNTGGSATSATATGEAVTSAASASFSAGGSQQYKSTYAAQASGDSQTLTFTALDSNGQPQTAKVSVTYAGGAGDGSAASTAAQINAALQATGNSALEGIVATTDNSGGSITFNSNSASKFTVSFGSNTTAAKGFTTDANNVKTSATVGTGASADISTAGGAANAVTALANAVAALGSAQGAVGKGENNLNYAINLAQSQVTNEAASESQIRDANLAQEAANLSKAQILVQAGTAALAQANSAPQQLLSLLQH
jgi:flagellin